MKSQTRRARFWRQLKSDKLSFVACVFLVIVIIASIFAFLTPYDPTAINLSEKFQPPSKAHFFGTDDYGRDYFTRALYGGRVSISAGVLAVILSTLIGVTVGAVSGYFGGILDNILMRILDIFLSIPWLVMVAIVAMFLNHGFLTIIVVIGCFSWLHIARIVRGETLTLKEREYVLYSNASGQSHLRIILKHILLPALPTIIVSSTLNISSAIMMESTLSFLGMGVQQPMSSWGSMLNNAQINIGTSTYLALFPGVLIIATVYSFNRLGEVIRVLVARD